MLIAESIPHMAWTAAPKGGITYLNERGWSYLGGDKECPAGLWASRIHPEDVDAVRTAWGSSIAREEEFDLEYRIRRFDGDFPWHSSRAIPMRDRNGVSYAWIGIATEIEDKKQMELALRRSEREATEAATLLRSIEAAAPIGLKLVDPEFRIVLANRMLAEVNGVTVGEMLGRTVPESDPDLWTTIGPFSSARAGR